ncbi:MAG: hypothetical protein KBT88_07365 [Gammaproteobacteria bacterium]|nr:hypothetical protein [Gammaproteobacteria bacterium]MBQ0839590.1 hypothetical protein [Gammaproteobacteria bacterium]
MTIAALRPLLAAALLLGPALACAATPEALPTAPAWDASFTVASSDSESSNNENTNNESSSDESSDQGWGSEKWGDEAESKSPFHGFIEVAYGTRSQSNPWIDRHDTLNETRLRIEYSDYFGPLYIGYKGDAFVDDLSWGGAFIETKSREALLRFSPSANSDLYLGRQVLTWGTGDLLFLNDLFPKDWVSFFAGRDMEYLKAPSDAIKASYFHKLANIDLVWTPKFDADTFIRGERFSYFSPLANDIVAAPPRLSTEQPGSQLDDGELALRVYKNIGGYEWALYGYHGYFKTPAAFNPNNGLNYFPKLSSIGASVRGTVQGGIANMEVAWYQSRDDSDGTDPFIPNSQLRFLSGFERELITRLTLGLQYYLEWTQDYSALKKNSPLPDKEVEEYRHLITTRLNYRAYQDKLTLSLFVFYSPTDDDFFAMPKVTYRLSDSWSGEVGANLFGGQDDYTFFGQFEENSNFFARLRYSF